MVMVLIGIGIGLAAGILSGLFGIGGGLIMVPALVMIGFTQREASGTSLAALVAPVAIFAVIQYAQRHEVRVPYAIGLGLGLAVGALFGAKFAGNISNIMLQRGFGLLMLIASVRFLFFAR